MKANKNRHLGLRIDEETHFKLHFIADHEGRSVNGELIYLVREHIAGFEEKNGKISMPGL